MQAQPDTLIAEDAKFYVDQFDRLQNSLPGRDIDWLHEQRKNSLARFGRIGFPGLKDEDWKYTSVSAVTGGQFNIDSARNGGLDENLSAHLIPDLQCCRLVFVDGVIDSALSDLTGLDGGLRIESIASVLAENPEMIQPFIGRALEKNSHGFTALNNALYRDGFVIIVEADSDCPKPIEILHVSKSNMSFSQPRNLIIAEKGSRARVIERYVSSAAESTLINSVTEILLAEHGEIDYCLIQNQSDKACHICGIWVNQSAGSRFSCRTVTLGGALVRNDLKTDLRGIEAHCDLLGVYGLAGKQHVDNHTAIVHGAENCSSRELYKGVLDQRSRSVFHGRIKVEAGARKTDAEQSSNTLLLSKNTEIDSKPQLEIYADDVKCRHGATIGQIDEESLFYLRTRGIDNEEARAFLTHAFVNDVIGQIEEEPLRRHVEEMFRRRLVPAREDRP